MTTTPSAKVILDSISIDGARLTTMEVVFHRFVLAEFNTHRKFSRNSASSRAMPISKTLDRVISDPAYPLKWPSEQPGMQGGDSLEDNDLWDAQELVDDIHSMVTRRIKTYIDDHPDPKERLHKSILNRYIEPFMWHTVIVTSTSFDGFFDQRCSPLAQPEIEAPAQAMRDAYNRSTPKIVHDREWHLPYLQEDEHDFQLPTKQALSVARCARVSYLNHDGKKDFDADIKLYQRLKSADPPHFSPFEHVATPVLGWAMGNAQNWKQLRYDMEIECRQRTR